MAADQTKLWRNIAIIALVCVVFLGIFMRFYHITDNDFFFYDEGYYLNANRFMTELIEKNYPVSLHEFFNAYYALARVSLATGKALWFLISDSRVFFLNAHDWFFPRLVSAIIGSLTLLVVFLFARNYYQSGWAAWLSMAVLAVLPSHIFYSRLAMQEACSTVLFLLGFYFYLFPKHFQWRTFLSALCFAGAFFTNYRLIFLPALIALCEFLLSFADRRMFDLRKYVWNVLTFFFLIFIIGNLDDAQNTTITFAWMFHQSQLAKQQFDLFNFLSYPYYVFRLESIVFAGLLFGNFYLIFRREWNKALPFVIVLAQMGIFSFAGEKGARYLCVVTPFMAMAVAWMAVTLFEKSQSQKGRIAVACLAALLIGTLIPRSGTIVQFKSGYSAVVEYLQNKSPAPKIVSTQPWIVNLYTADKNDVIQCPREYRYLVQMYLDGFRYLVIGPQAYISWTQDGKRFSRDLKGYLNFVVTNLEPIKTFPHLDKTMLERFVLEHNENLRTSLEFLKAGGEKPGALRIYDIKQLIDEINRRVKFLKR